MHIYGVFKEDGSTPYGLLCGRATIPGGPALYGNEESAIEWATYLGSSHPRCTYAVFKFNLNPNGFTADNVYRTSAPLVSLGP